MYNNGNFASQEQGRGRRQSSFRPRTNGGRRNFQNSKGMQLHHFVKKASPVEETTYKPLRKFEEFDIHPKLKETLIQKGFTYPTEIQERSINDVIAGRDLLGIAKTGTGKTGAFLIPIIHRLLSNADEPFQTLIVVPTRELALQVKEEFRSLTFGLNLFAECFIGGTSIRQDLRRLQRPSHIVVGTPGRLLDLSDQGALRLEYFSVLVLDEYDRMLDMGFVDDVKALSDRMEAKTQTLLFSATTNKDLPIMVNNPVEVLINSSANTTDHIEQNIVRVASNENKFDVLLNMLQGDNFEKVIIFAETKGLVDELTRKLVQNGVYADCIHGDKSQFLREKALSKLKKNIIKVLVATDIASRGIDVSDVTHVINYQRPTNHESYVHRIGRTGRAGKVGFAFTFVD